jgi:hypothetical protein
MFKLSDLEKKNKTKIVFVESLDDEVEIRKLTALETKEYQMMQIGKDRELSVNDMSNEKFIANIKLTTDEIVQRDFESGCFLIASGLSVKTDIDMEQVKTAKFTEKQFTELFKVIREYSDINNKKLKEVKDFSKAGKGKSTAYK